MENFEKKARRQNIHLAEPAEFAEKVKNHDFLKNFLKAFSASCPLCVQVNAVNGREI
jgi:hypothetical protein